MAFQIKDFASIVASCINWMRASTQKVTDFNIGSTARTLIEGPAAELDQLYMQMFIGLKEAIPVSVFNSFSFDRLAARAASGQVRVIITSSASATLIPAGTTFKTATKSGTYVSTADVTIAAGNTQGDVPVVYSVDGVEGNLSSGLAFTPSPAPANYVSASNVAAFIDGRAEETDDERKLRFNAFIATISRATVDSLKYGAKTAEILNSSGSVVERVASAIVVEPYLADPLQPTGWSKVYIHNGSGSTSAGLVTLVSQIIAGYTDSAGVVHSGWKAAGVKVDVIAAGDQLLGVTGVITSLPGYDHAKHIADATAAISAYLTVLDIGAKAIRAQIIELVMSIDGVYNFTVSSPAGDTTPAATDKILPGTLAIT